MQKIKKGIESLDKFPGNAHLNWNGVRQKKNLFGGIIAISFIVIVLALIISKFVGLLNRKQIQLSSFIRRDVDKMKFDGLEVMFVMFKFDGQNISYMSEAQYEKRGILVGAIEVTIDYRNKSQEKTNVELYPFHSCLSSYMLCNIFIEYEPQCSYEALDFQTCDYVKQYHIVVTNSTKNEPNLTNLYPMLFLFDTKFDLKDINASNILRNNPITVNKLTFGLDKTKQYVYEVPVSKLQITIDQSLLPSAVPGMEKPQYSQHYFYPNERLRMVSDQQSFFYGLLPTYFDFYIYRSGFTQNYYRSYTRIDTMLAEIFGLISTLTIIFALFCSGYNQWRMQKHIQQSLSEDGQKINKSYLAYFKQIIRKLSCKKEKNQKQQEVIYSNDLNQPINSSITEQSPKNVDIIKMYKRIVELERDMKTLKNMPKPTKQIKKDSSHY